jgi:hypothetical protein
MPENDGDAEQRTLFPIRSDLAVIKEGAGALKVETVLDEIAKLEQLCALGLPEDLLGSLRTTISVTASGGESCDIIDSHNISAAIHRIEDDHQVRASCR